MTKPGKATALSAAMLSALSVLAAGCITHNVESKPIEIKPIHITMDINLRVQRELDEFFDFEDKAAPAASAKGDGTQQGKE
jgi:hypothetical protein